MQKYWWSMYWRRNYEEVCDDPFWGDTDEAAKKFQDWFRVTFIRKSDCVPYISVICLKPNGEKDEFSYVGYKAWLCAKSGENNLAEDMVAKVGVLIEMEKRLNVEISGFTIKELAA